MARERRDLDALLRRVALRLRRCDMPAEETLPVFAGAGKELHDQPFSNIELAAILEGIATEREEQMLLALKTALSSGELTPRQMVETARLLGRNETNGDISVNPGFLLGLAEIAERALPPDETTGFARPSGAPRFGRADRAYRR
ncbi:MAG: hypothetical protein HYV19_04300 [Gemmatimonadetes bacterium]|nr:hypothetical protein [Gemmatimonadota bacterium]